MKLEWGYPKSYSAILKHGNASTTRFVEPTAMSQRSTTYCRPANFSYTWKETHMEPEKWTKQEDFL